MPRVYNFSAGPAIMPEKVLTRAAEEMLDWNGSGMSVMEMSHRSKVYLEIYNSALQKIRNVMLIPSNYKVLFLQGGATLQFSAIAMNLLSATGKADYAVTGYFSKKAKKLGAELGEALCAADSGDYSSIPGQSDLKLCPDASYFHYCHNNTVYGTVWPYIPNTGNVPIVCDMSSSILSEPMDVSRYGVIYAGAQKNMGPAGLTVVIVREDLLDRTPLPGTPELLTYAAQAKNDSMINTPPTYGIYLLGLVLDWVTENGGLEAMAKRNREKAAMVYNAVDESKLFTARAEKSCRSIMNPVFTSGDEDKDTAFIKAASAKGLVNLKGHRATGGIRASMYNAMPLEGAKLLAETIREFDAVNA